MKPQLQQILTLTIVRMGIHGEGVASHEGFTIFVEGALPKERVRASLFEVRKNYGRARVLEILETSPHRVKPPCPVFGRCGGCQIMHLDYSQQLETKRQRVIDALERIGKIYCYRLENANLEDAKALGLNDCKSIHISNMDRLTIVQSQELSLSSKSHFQGDSSIKVDVKSCIPSPSPFSYRNKIQLPYQNSHLGLFAFNSHELVEIEKCYIHCPLGERAFSCIKALLQRSPAPNLRHVLIKTAVNTDQVLVILVTDNEEEVLKLAQEIKGSMREIRGVVQNINEATGNVVLGKTYKTLVGEGCIFDTICDLTFKVSPASFFQVNPPQAENLYRKALEACQLKGDETVLDAYCGVGTLSLLLAQKAKKVVGVEAVPEAIEDAQENGRLNQIENVEFTCALAEDFIGELSGIDVAVINPPRKGCEPSFLNKLIELEPKQIVYISCDPATLARDLAILQGGKYHIQTVQPFDMFPQTVHVETLVSLSLSE